MHGTVAIYAARQCYPSRTAVTSLSSDDILPSSEFEAKFQPKLPGCCIVRLVGMDLSAESVMDLRRTSLPVSLLLVSLQAQPFLGVNAPCASRADRIQLPPPAAYTLRTQPPSSHWCASHRPAVVATHNVQALLPDNRIDIPSGDVVDASPAKQVLRTVGVILALVLVSVLVLHPTLSSSMTQPGQDVRQ